VSVDFGLDSLFLQEEVKLTSETESKIRDNVRKLIEFTNKVEKNSGASARLLWSESEENLAQKLVSRLQKLQ
jgi:Holliday junction resolvase